MKQMGLAVNAGMSGKLDIIKAPKRKRRDEDSGEWENEPYWEVTETAKLPDDTA